MLVRPGGFGIDVKSARTAESAAPEAVQAALADLLAYELSCAPHVVVRLVDALSDDRLAIRQVVWRLDRAQRQGLRPLPSPLPLVGAVRMRFAGLRLTLRDRELLLAMTLRLDDRLEPLLAFDGRALSELSGGALSRLIEVHAGHARILDPRLAVWVRGSTTSSVVADVHDRLHRIHLSRGEREDAAWHGARASVRGDTRWGRQLTRLAARTLGRGLADRALVLSREAAEHSDGSLREEAAAVAGMAAIAGGYAEEAASWLSGLDVAGSGARHVRCLGALILARTHLEGLVPPVAPAALRPRTRDAGTRRAWSAATGVAAVLCAERGDRRGMRSWLDAARSGDVNSDADRDVRDLAAALARMLAGYPEDDAAVAESGPGVSGAVLGALRAARRGRLDPALALLAAQRLAPVTRPDPLVAGFERTPLAAAHVAVVEVLLLFWRGDIAAAHARMLAASSTLPVAVPFDGLGVVLARRLDLAVLGRLGSLSLALTDSLPGPSRVDVLMDRAIEAQLRGDDADAALCLALWADRGAPTSILAVPGLDGESMSVRRHGEPPRRIEPPQLAIARALRDRIAVCPDADWLRERGDIAAAARAVASPFDRARVEEAIGVREVMQGAVGDGRRHLQAARELFREAGAGAWARAVAARLARLDVAAESDDRVDPLSASRRVWQRMLTSRELEVAMLTVGGASNRDIGDALAVSVRTVEVHLGRVFAKLDVRSRVELTILAHRVARHA